MRVAIVGSWKLRDEGKLKANEDKFATAYNDLGKKISRNGHSIIIGSRAEHTADFHVMMGVLDELGRKRTTRPFIRV
jgi:hypothetical protein